MLHWRQNDQFAAIRDLTGTYTAAYVCAAGFSLLALVMSIVLLRAERKRT